MPNISNTFAEIKNRCALIPFITAGDPDLLTTRKALRILAEEGADIIELGLPYSDPLADGLTIQAASARAIKSGVTLDQILQMVKQVTSEIQSPLIAFTYYNIVLNQGVTQFIRKIADAGFKGLLIPDLPIEEVKGLEDVCRGNDLELVLLVGPNSSEKRIRKIVAKSQGCVYLVSSNGVTGMSFGPEKGISTLIQKIKQVSDIPLILGFGISNREEIQLVKSWHVDGVVIGSSFVKKLYEDSSANDPDLPLFREYCQYVKSALDA